MKIGNPKDSLVLFGLTDQFNLLVNLYKSNKFPKTLMLSGEKGSGKFTLINHFLTFLNDEKNYDLKNKKINNQSDFYKQYYNNVFPNIIHIEGKNFKNISVEDIRELKSKLHKTNISNKNRYIILDDIETFNINTLNALLKLIEEPSLKNYFILINNKTKKLIDTVQSRSLEFKILLTKKKRSDIIKSLINLNNLNIFIDYNFFNLTPGNFLFFNQVFQDNEINIEDDYIKNLTILINMYHKNKDTNITNIILFLTDYYFHQLIKKEGLEISKVIENKSFVVNNINKFITFNINQNSLLNAINNRLHNE